MVSSRQQRCAVKFCFKLGKSASETFELIKQAYGNDEATQEFLSCRKCLRKVGNSSEAR